MYKQEKIKIEWQKVLRKTTFSCIEHFVTDNGWISQNALSKEEKLLIREVEIDKDFIRPISLNGIDNNNGWIQVISDFELTEYSQKLEPIWILLEDDDNKISILVQPDVNDNYYSPDDIIYHYADISHFMKIIKPKPPIY